MWALWWTKGRWGWVSPNTLVSPANLYFTNFSTITLTYHMGLAYASSGRSTQSLTALIKKIPLWALTACYRDCFTVYIPTVDYLFCYLITPLAQWFSNFYSLRSS
jgi:hypothetical protein